MSFILDALKKSESERNRQSGPTLLEVRVAPPRSRVPLWAIVIALAVLANLAVLGYLLLRPAPPAPAIVQSAPAATAAPATPVPAQIPGTAASSAGASVLPDPATVTTPLPASSSSSTAPVQDSADYAPAIAAHNPAGAALSQSGPSPASDMGLPTINDLNASGANLPELRLSLHVYDADPSRRYVLLNSTRLREGETTPDGIHLERITEGGVVLSWRNRRFTLQRGE